MASTTAVPVSGRLHCSTILGLPALSAWFITTTTRLTPATRSIAPPMPLKIGRASCRESVSVRVDLGGRRIIKKKKNTILESTTCDNKRHQKRQNHETNNQYIS